ncbi:hypothetical protein BHC44_01700 [Snodgrassella alvi]|nr:hypothetical protein BHC44_01700 [Snodgrassella alvi]
MKPILILAREVSIYYILMAFILTVLSNMIDYIQPGSPYQNGYIEQFNRTYRAEVLDLYLFNNLEQARKVTEEWLTIYNTERPHEALNNMTPSEYKTLKQAA